jgi:zinc protease
VRRWYAFAYRPDLTTVAIVGDVTPARAFDVVRKYFGGWRAFGPMPRFAYPPLPRSTVKSETITVKSASASQSSVTLKQAFELGRGDRDYAPLLLANTMLSGESTGSLLFREVRTHRGYVYDVRSSLDVDRDQASFTVSYESNPADVDRAQAAIVSVLERMQTTPMANVDLERAKAELVASLVLPLDSYDGIASQLLRDGEFGTTAAATDRFWHTLLATTPEQVRDAMQRHLRPNHFLRVIVAPAG